jgi:hypothetical protein
MKPIKWQKIKSDVYKRERERGTSGRNYFWNAADAETAGVGVRMEKNDSQNPTI